MSQSNSATFGQQHLLRQFGAFEQHFSNLYAQQEPTAFSYQQHQQQQRLPELHAQLSMSSSSTSSSPSVNTIQTSLSHQHLHQHQHQSHTPPAAQQQHLDRHSISLTSLPMSSSSSSPMSPTTTAAAVAAAALASNTATSILENINSQQPQHTFSMHNQQQLQQLDAQQQQQLQQQNGNAIAAISATASSSLDATGATAVAPASPSTTNTAANLTATATTMHQHQQHQHHQHQSHHAGNTSPYKSCWCFGDQTYHMKILVPAVASGAIIGKGGETIASLQKDSGARVKMSKSHDFYPGTNERVCLITGSAEGIMSVLDFIMDKIREKPDMSMKIMDSESKQAQERDKQVKILVPNSTAGMIIGKGGAFIKQIKEESGSYVQISQKPKDISLQERCITIIGDKENNKNACKMILSKIVEDPQSGTCLNVSYADVNGPVANFNPTGSPYASNQNAINSSTASLNSTLGNSMGGAGSAAGLLVNGTGINLSLNLGSPNPAPNLAVATQLLEHIKVALRGSGYSETATTEVCAALGVLAKYGVLGMGVGVPHSNGAHTTLGSYLGVSALDQQSAAAAAAANAANAGNVFGAVGQVNLEQYTAAAAAAAAAAARPSQLEAAAAQFDPFRHLSSAAQAATPVSLNNNSFGLSAASAATGQTLGANALSGMSKSPTPGDLGAKDTKNVEIPEVIVGAILGPNGRSLVEIQHISGANVQISKKGIFAPGTRNRIVTITGQQGAIAKAQYLIEQKINEEESKRARQIPLTTVVN